LGKLYELRLTPARELAGQRVTLSLNKAPIELVARGLQELLSAGEEVPVLWVRAGERAWTLEQSENRRRLVARLQNQDIELFRQHLQDRIEWARQGGPRDVVDPSLRRAQLEPFAIATLLDSIGDAGREKLLAGAPFVTQVGKLPTAAHDLLLQYLTFRNG